MKLIDAELLLEEINKGATIEDLKKLVTECKGVPVTVNAEPVLHCKDCEYWDEEDHGCNIRDSYGWDYKPDDFCSYGERREP